MQDPPIKPEDYPFVPYRTMFKLEEQSEVGEISSSRRLECVSCGHHISWKAYRMAPDEIDKECPECKVRAFDFYSGKKTQGVPRA